MISNGCSMEDLFNCGRYNFNRIIYVNFTPRGRKIKSSYHTRSVKLFILRIELYHILRKLIRNRCRKPYPMAS